LATGSWQLANFTSHYHHLHKIKRAEMAQGAIKSKKSTAPTAKSSGRRQAALGPKKGARTIAPKKQVLVRNAKMTKVGDPSSIFRLQLGIGVGQYR